MSALLDLHPDPADAVTLWCRGLHAVDRPMHPYSVWFGSSMR